MLRPLLFLSALFLSYISFAQTVENIRVEPEGDKIKVYYRIGGSTEAQLYNVMLTCSMDGEARFEPQAVVGDVGKNIRGGKSYYTILWDVFEDVDEVGSAEFFVKVELVEDAASPVTPYREQPEKTDVEVAQMQLEPTDQGFRVKESSAAGKFANRFLISYGASSYNLFGFSAGTLGNWGLYGSVRLGSYDEYLELLSGSFTGGITKNFFSAGKYRLHGYAGAGIGDYFDTFNVEAGLSNVLWNRLVLTVGLEYPMYYADVVFGIGIVL